MEVTSATIIEEGQEEEEKALIQLSDEFVSDTYLVQRLADKVFSEGKTYTLDIEYKKKILTGNTGVYCSTDPRTLTDFPELKSLADLHLIEDEAKRLKILDESIFCTNLEPAEARSFLPCLDEPSFKAKFKLSINLSEAQKHHTAISNTPVESQEDGLVTFEWTPKMSTYLLVCVVGKFEYVEVPMIRDSGERVQVRGYSPHGHKESIRHFIELAAESLTARHAGHELSICVMRLITYALGAVLNSRYFALGANCSRTRLGY